MKNLLRLVYTSKPYGLFEDGSLEALLEKSRSNNYERDITGVLHFGNGLFMQVLEGPETEVISLYSKILADSRHRDCAILSVNLIQRRLFGSWSMGFVSRSKTMNYGYNELLDFRRPRDDSAEMRTLIDSLVEVLREG